MQNVFEFLVICFLYDLILSYMKEGLNVCFYLCRECANMIARFHKNAEEGIGMYIGM